MRRTKIVHIPEETKDAKEVHEELLSEGARVWGVVVSPSGAEVYFYEDEETEEGVREKLQRAHAKRTSKSHEIVEQRPEVTM